MAVAVEQAELTAAFRSFNELSSALEASYRDLESQVARLTAELAQARRERVRQLEERERYQRLATLGEMAARLAHDVRTPLAAALLYASRLGADTLPDGDRREIAAKVVGRLRHLEALVADMLSFARGGAGSVARCDVAALLESAAQSLASRLDEGATLTIRTQAPGLAVHGNAEALVGAVVNLATNALDAAGPRAAVEIEARLDGAMAAIRVRDNGPGVAPEHSARIFDPFYTTRPGGTGLGLAVVKSVALAHGGAVRLEEAPVGACFALELPAAGSDA